MKTNLCSIKVMVFGLFLPFAIMAQPGYVFKNPSLVSGTPLKTGAVYKYSTVYINTDALVTITGMTNDASLSAFDRNLSGYDNAFQPVIICPAGKKAYVEFRVDFVESSNNAISKIMAEVAATGIDIDGQTSPAGNVAEFDQFKTTADNYVNFNMSGGDLNVNQQAGWYEAMNRTVSAYTGIDTAARNVMFSMVSANVSSISFRIGADNRSPVDNELEGSIYFKKFPFQSMVLPVPLMTYFSGVAGSSTVTLNWTMASVEDLKSIVVERSVRPNEFQPIEEMVIKNNKKVSFTFTDNGPGNDKVYYRLVFVPKNEKNYFSKVLFFQMTPDPSSSWFTAFPAIFRNDLTIRVKAETDLPATLRIINYAGAIVYHEQINLSSGTNTIMIDGGRIPHGNYIAVMETGGREMSQKIVKP